MGLSSLREGDTCTVHAVTAGGNMRCRLRDLGFIEGSQVRCLQRSFSGDPTAYFVKGAVIALRKEDASDIIVTKNAVR